MQAIVTERRDPYHYSGLSTALKPTTGIPYGSTYYETDTAMWKVFTMAGWITESGLDGASGYVHIHTITPTIVNPAAAQTDVVTIDGVACSFTSDATPTAAEIVAGLQAAIAASAAVGKFVVSGVATLILTPATAVDPVVSVSANLTDVQTIGVSVLGSVTISAALPAGTNNIGDVDVLTLPSLPAGTNNIGDVDVLTIPALVAGEAHIGEVGFNGFPVVVTPPIAAAAFSANDVVGGKLTLANAVRVAAGSGKLDSLLLVDASKQNAPLTIFLFKADLAGAYADNAAEAVTGADWLKCIGQIDILATDYKQWSNASLVALGGLDLDVFAAAGTTIYGLIVTTGTPTYGANALQLTFGFGRRN